MHPAWLGGCGVRYPRRAAEQPSGAYPYAALRAAPGRRLRALARACTPSGHRQVGWGCMRPAGRMRASVGSHAPAEGRSARDGDSLSGTTPRIGMHAPAERARANPSRRFVTHASRARHCEDRDARGESNRGCTRVLLPRVRADRAAREAGCGCHACRVHAALLGCSALAVRHTHVRGPALISLAASASRWRVERTWPCIPDRRPIDARCAYKQSGTALIARASSSSGRPGVTESRGGTADMASSWVAWRGSCQAVHHPPDRRCAPCARAGSPEGRRSAVPISRTSVLGGTAFIPFPTPPLRLAGTLPVAAGSPSRAVLPVLLNKRRQAYSTPVAKVELEPSRPKNRAIGMRVHIPSKHAVQRKVAADGRWRVARAGWDG